MTHVHNQGVEIIEWLTRTTVFISGVICSVLCLYTAEIRPAWQRTAHRVQPPLAALPPDSVFAISTFVVVPIYAALLSPMKKLVREHQKRTIAAVSHFLFARGISKPPFCPQAQLLVKPPAIFIVFGLLYASVLPQVDDALPQCPRDCCQDGLCRSQLLSGLGIKLCRFAYLYLPQVLEVPRLLEGLFAKESLAPQVIIIIEIMHDTLHRMMRL